MSNIQICRQHDIGEEGCQNLAEELLDKLVEKFGGYYRTKGEAYTYKHTAGITATVEPKPEELVINVKLGIMARAFAPQLEQEMNKVLDDYL